MKGTDDVLKLLVETKGMQYNPEKHTIRVPGSSPRIEVVLHRAAGRPLSTYVLRGCMYAEDIVLVPYGLEHDALLGRRALKAMLDLDECTMLNETSEHSLAWLDEAVGSCLRQTKESVFVLARFGYHASEKTYDC
jgi:hypothetical protein